MASVDHRALGPQDGAVAEVSRPEPTWTGADGKERPYLGQPYETPELPYAVIQWKGTAVCMDPQCVCGESFHIDADFAHFVRCPHCGRTYQMDWYVRMKQCDPAEAYVEPITEERDSPSVVGWTPEMIQALHRGSDDLSGVDD